jgi:uncharacterized protein (TIGR03437 family)
MVFYLRSCGRAAVLVCLFLLGVTQVAHASFSLTFQGEVRTVNTGGSITLGSPAALVVDPAGDVYIADTGNSRIVEVSAQGTASVLSITGLSPASLSSPSGIAIDGAGNLYIGDTGNSRVVKVSPSGAGSTISTGSVQLSTPEGIALDQSGDIFIADPGHSQIVEVTSGGSAATLTINVSSGVSSLTGASGLAVDASGTLYIADTEHNRVVTLAPGSTTGVVFGTGELSPALSNPSGVAVDRIGNVYIADTGHNRIVEVDTTGLGTNLANLLPFESLLLSAPLGVAVDAFGAIYIADTGNSRALVVDPGLDGDNGEYADLAFYNSSLNKTAVGFGHISLGSSTPTSLILDFSVGSPVSALGGVNAFTSGTQGLDFQVVSGANSTCSGANSGTYCTVEVSFLPTSPGLRNGALVLYDPDSNPVLTVPLYGFGDAPVAALAPNTGTVLNTGGVPLVYPFQIALDGAGNMYVANDGGGAGNLVKIPAGGGTASLVSPSGPNTLGGEVDGVALDGAGNLFISDHQNNRIIVITPGGVASQLSIAGPSPLSEPTALAFDAAGNLYISDYGNGRVVEVSSLFVSGSTSTGIGTVIGTGSYTTSTDGITGVAVDSMGNIYITDGYSLSSDPSRVIKVTAAGVASLLTPTGITFSSPTGVGVDGMGNIYVADGGNNRIVEITTAGVASVLAINGLPSPTSLGEPFGVTVDPFGNLYIPDTLNSRVLFVNVSGAAMTFPFTATGATSAAQTATVSNLGNQPLVFSTNPTYTPNFSDNSGDENPCTSATSLSPGINCDVSVEFTPQSVGSLSAGITVTNNALNVGGSTQQVSVSGTGFSSVRSTTTTVMVSPPSSTYGQLLVFTATVSAEEPTDVPYRPWGVSRPTGTITFTDLTTLTTLASNVILSAGVATFSLSTLGAGSHTIQAVYTPTGSFSASSGTAALTIAKAATSTAVTLSGRTLTAAVSVIPPGAGTPTGSLQFLNGGSALGTVTLSGGTASLTLAVTPRSFLFTAVYSGASNFSGSTSAAVTSPPTSSVFLTSSANPSALGQAVTFTAAVSGQPSSAGLVTGIVQFSDGATALGSASVLEGQAVFTTSALTGGSHSIVAEYSGGGAFPPAEVRLDQTVSAPVTMTTSVAPAATVFGQTMVFTASVSATVPPGFAAPTGHVTWVDLASGTQLGTAPLSSGTATFSLNSLAAGTHTITVLYSGDATWISAAGTLTITVSRAASNSAVSIAIVSGQLTLTANVAAIAPGAGTPTGSVQFLDVAKNAIVATATLSSGTGSATMGTGAVADVLGRPIAAVYSGDSNFNGSKSAPLPALVNAAWNYSGNFAPDEIASLYGITGLTGDTTATSAPTTSLSGVTVTIRDSSGAVSPALLYGVYASAGQINLLVPGGIVAGLAVVTINLPGGGTITTIVNIVGTAPGIFTANASGQGVFAGQVVYVHQDGSQTIVSSTGPISLAGGGQVYLVLYGTGLRHAKSVTATVNGASVPVIYFGAQEGGTGGSDTGLDQINVGPLPANLAGSGVVKLVIAADGQAANTVTLNIQ